MFRIGEFASVTGISIYMLRNYDKMGLLIPEKIDEESGYRYYSEKQIVIANQIQMLKSLGFGLKEISTIQLSSSSSQQMKQFLEKKIVEKENERNEVSRQIQQMQHAISELEANEQYAMTVAVKHIPARKVACVRDIIYAFPQEGQLWDRLTNECNRLKVKFADVDYSFAITHHIDFQHFSVDVEVQRVVEQLRKDTETVTFKVVPECDVAAVAFCGNYDQMGALNHYVMDWIQKNGYQMVGNSFSTYYISPGNEKNPANFITELCFPILKRVKNPINKHS